MVVLSRGIAIQRIACGRRRKHHLLLIGDLQVSYNEVVCSEVSYYASGKWAYPYKSFFA